jgi:hypothetical protein
MKIRILLTSFQLPNNKNEQAILCGTLQSGRFSPMFWMNLLPSLYNHNIMTAIWDGTPYSFTEMFF